MAGKDATTGASADALELLTSDHRAVEQLFHQLNNASANTDIARHVAEEIVTELSVHAAIEEQVLYPGLRTTGAEGDRLADRSLYEHQEMKELLAEVDGRPVDDASVQSVFTRLQTSVERHVGEEEGVIFPLLR